MVLRGSIRVSYSYTENGQQVEGSHDYAIGESVVIKATVEHTIKALEPNSMYACVFSHRDFDGQVAQVYMGNDEAYI
jgi:quercetin dioxygenase-like cupin family protein